MRTARCDRRDKLLRAVIDHRCVIECHARDPRAPSVGALACSWAQRVAMAAQASAALHGMESFACRGGSACARHDALPVPSLAHRWRRAAGAVCLAMTSPPDGGSSSSSSRGSSNGQPSSDGSGASFGRTGGFLTLEDNYERHQRAAHGMNTRIGDPNFSDRLLKGEQILQSYLSGRVHQVGTDASSTPSRGQENDIRLLCRAKAQHS